MNKINLGIEGNILKSLFFFFFFLLLRNYGMAFQFLGNNGNVMGRCIW